jgi:hypothetical protein
MFKQASFSESVSGFAVTVISLSAMVAPEMKKNLMPMNWVRNF